MCPFTFTVDWLVAENTCANTRTDLAGWVGCTAVDTPTATKVSDLGTVTGCTITCAGDGAAFVVSGDLISVCFLAMAWCVCDLLQ